MEYKKFSERLKAVRKALGLSVNAMEVATKVGGGVIQKCEANGTSIGADKIEKILLTYPEINADWLLAGRGSMLKGQDYPEAIASEPATEYGKKPSAYDIANLDKRLRLIEIQVKSLDLTSDQHAIKIAEVDSKVESVLREFIKEHS